ncbi:MAG: hypothetical protein GY866_24375, partial [Proteobacteria bacterium]|nr:hypothetical protein [Pseudomonadota bacterium]
DAPRAIAEFYDDRVVQIIDEFQYINRFIYRDKAREKLIGNLAGSYLHTCEYRNAPLLVSGSWVGWLVDDLGKMLPGRFGKDYLDNMPMHESVEMVYNYSFYYNIPVTEETACTIAELCEGNPFYISSLFESKCPGLDLSKEEGVLNALEFETMDSRGFIKSIWMEYIEYALSRVNSQETKNIILYLSKNRDREITRKELLDKLNLSFSDKTLEEKLAILVNSDIIEQGVTNYDFHGVRDNIFDKVFRGVYQKEID